MHKFFRRVAPSQIMRGSTHLFMSIMIYTPTFIFLLKLGSLSPDIECLYILSAVGFGIALGSLLPDLDAPGDSKIMYGWWRPFGLLGKNVLYKPLKRLLGRRTEHREILHSLIGCLFASILFAMISLVPYAIALIAQVALPIIWFFWIGIPIGFILHLAEDSFTYYGVKWFYPSDKTIHGNIATNSGGEYNLLKVSMVVFGLWPPILFYLLPASLIMVYLSIGITIVLLPILHRMNRKISVIGNSRYSLEKLVELYIEDVGGERIKPREPHGPILKLEYSGNRDEKQYIAQITGVDCEYVLCREWLVSPVECSSEEEGDILEMQVFENQKKKRVYYIVQYGIFYTFLKRYL